MEYADQVVKVDITGINMESAQQDDKAIAGFMSTGSLSTFDTKKPQLPNKHLILLKKQILYFAQQPGINPLCSYLHNALSKIYLQTYIVCANAHTVWNTPGCFALTSFYFWNVLNAWMLLWTMGSSSKMRLFQCCFLNEIKETMLEKQRSTK